MSDIKRMLSSIIRENGNYVSRDKAAESLRELTELEAKNVGLAEMLAAREEMDSLNLGEFMSIKAKNVKLEKKLEIAVEAIAVALIDLRNSDDQNESIQNAYSLLDEAFKKIKAKQ